MGKFEIIEELGRGPVGVVYKARDPLIGRLVAIKTITADSNKDPSLFERFYAEARIAGTLQHPNIITIYEHGKEVDTFFIAMEFVDGETLENLIKRRPALPLSQKLGYMVQVCRALDYAHTRKPEPVVHRDIKPGNVMITSDGIIKVIDFGINRLGNTARTRTGMLVGTFAYMSPEMINGQDVNAKCDIWATGVMFYELLAYQRPFVGESLANLISNIMLGSFHSMADAAPGTPPDVAAVVDRMLRKRAEERYQTMEEVLLDLEPIWKRIQNAEVSSLVADSTKALEEHDLVRAEEMTRNALVLDTANTQAKNLLLRINHEIRRNQLIPQVQERVKKGQELLDAGKLEEAEAEVRTALQLDKTFQPALDLIARCEQAQISQRLRLEQCLETLAQGIKDGRFQDAIQAAETCLGEFPRNMNLIFLRDKALKLRDEKKRFLDQKIKEIRNKINNREFSDAIRLAQQSLDTLGPDTDVDQLLLQSEGELHQREKQQEQPEMGLEAGKPVDAENLGDFVPKKADPFAEEPFIPQNDSATSAFSTKSEAGPSTQPIPPSASPSDKGALGKSKQQEKDPAPDDYILMAGPPLSRQEAVLLEEGRTQTGSSRVLDHTLDLALSPSVPVLTPVELVALLRQAGSTSLGELLERDRDTNLRGDMVRNRDLGLEFKRDSTGKLTSTDVTMRVIAPDFEPKLLEKVVRVHPHKDCQRQTFLLTPQHLGTLTIQFDLLAGDVTITSGSLKTSSEPSDRCKVASKPAIVSFPLSINVLRGRIQPNTHMRVIAVAVVLVVAIASLILWNIKKVSIRGVHPFVDRTTNGIVTTNLDGKNYALLVAIDRYNEWPSLRNPIKDASDVENELTTYYGFNARHLYNAKRDDILTEIKSFANGKYSTADQLFVYFAGHGLYDEAESRGFLVAADSKLDDPIHTTQLSHSDLREVLDALPIKHVFVVIDACFGGAFDPRIDEATHRGTEYSDISLDELRRRKIGLITRQYLTSGSKEFVPDGRGMNSPFASTFLEALRTYGGESGYLSITRLRPYFERTESDARQGNFGKDNAGSEFFFIPVRK